MPGLLLASTGIKTEQWYAKGAFQPFLKGWILPIFDLPLNSEVVRSKILVSSFLSVQELVNKKLEPIAYYVYSNSECITGDFYILSHGKVKSPRQVTRIFHNDDIVILEYPKQATLALSANISPMCNTILEEQ